MGLTTDDVMLELDKCDSLPKQLAISPGQALLCLEAESTLLFLVASDIAAGKPVNSATKNRVVQAAARINEVRRLINVINK
jgi:hypothetical protein